MGLDFLYWLGGAVVLAVLSGLHELWPVVMKQVFLTLVLVAATSALGAVLFQLSMGEPGVTFPPLWAWLIGPNLYIGKKLWDNRSRKGS